MEASFRGMWGDAARRRSRQSARHDNAHHATPVQMKPGDAFSFLFHAPTSGRRGTKTGITIGATITTRRAQAGRMLPGRWWWWWW